MMAQAGCPVMTSQHTDSAINTDIDTDIYTVTDIVSDAVTHADTGRQVLTQSHNSDIFS